MKLLIFDWGAYTYPDIAETIKMSGISFYTVSYHFDNKNNDDFFAHKFLKHLKLGKYDAVFSVNYFPLVAECCRTFGIKYISWSYDNPLNVERIEETLGYETNYVFLFDRIQTEHYINRGFNNVYYLPLAVNTHRLDRVVSSSAEKEILSSDISFVGKLYDSNIGIYMSGMNDYQRGYIDSIVKVQSQLYGTYLVDNLLTDDFIKTVNSQYRSTMSNPVTLTKEMLSYAVAARITREERLLLLSLLSRHYHVNLFSREQNDLLKNVAFLGSCDYLDRMPKVFKNSKINLNITLKILQSGVPLRALDIMGAGGFLLSNYQPEIDDFFENNHEVVMYESVEDAFEKATFYLKHDDLRKNIALNGYRKVAEKFTYADRLKTIFYQSGLNF